MKNFWMKLTFILILMNPYLTFVVGDHHLRLRQRPPWLWNAVLMSTREGKRVPRSSWPAWSLSISSSSPTSYSRQKDAGSIAVLNALQIVKEPTAADCLWIAQEKRRWTYNVEKRYGWQHYWRFPFHDWEQHFRGEGDGEWHSFGCRGFRRQDGGFLHTGLHAGHSTSQDAVRTRQTHLVLVHAGKDWDRFIGLVPRHQPSHFWWHGIRAPQGQHCIAEWPFSPWWVYSLKAWGFFFLLSLRRVTCFLMEFCLSVCHSLVLEFQAQAVNDWWSSGGAGGCSRPCGPKRTSGSSKKVSFGGDASLILSPPSFSRVISWRWRPTFSFQTTTNVHLRGPNGLLKELIWSCKTNPHASWFSTGFPKEYPGSGFTTDSKDVKISHQRPALWCHTALKLHVRQELTPRSWHM